MRDKDKSHAQTDLESQPKESRSAAATSDPGSTAPWLLGHKVQLPHLVAGYVERPELEERCSPMQRHLTVLQAPGGFGKTALLARCCRRLRDEGTPVAWLSVDEDDGPAELATYLALAFERAGVETFDSSGTPTTEPPPKLQTDTRAGYRINLLIRAIERHGSPCLLVLDEMERMASAEAIAVLNALLRHAPEHLRFAMAFRERPAGLDIAMFLLESRGETVTVEDLRFSQPDIARFFDTKLSRRELTSLATNSAGWPIALRIYRNALLTGTGADEVDSKSDTVAAWIESRLWRGLTDEDRDFVLDLSLFDWIDAELIDEATGRRHSGRRIESMTSLTGLSHTSGGDQSTKQLHPLIREYCANRRFREDPTRFRSIHAAIARGLAHRGHVVDALRHAAEAGDSGLVGEIASKTDCINLWIGRGFDALSGIDDRLTADVIAAYPRLALIRCLVLAMSGDMDEARRVYQTAAIESAGFTLGPDGVEDPKLKADHVLTLGLMLVFGCSRLTRYEPTLTACAGFARNLDIDPLTRGLFRHGMCMARNEMTEFDEAAVWARRARADLGRSTLYLSPHIDYQLGIAAMAQGRTSEAERYYDRALKMARIAHLGNAATVMVGEILTAELQLERSGWGLPLLPSPVSTRLLGECGVWLDIYAANTGVAAELALLDRGVDDALAVVEDAREFGRATERSALVTFSSALRISLLLIGQRIEDAAQAWRTDDLPDDDEGCLDFKNLRWREVEAIASARLRLLIAQERFDLARPFAARLCARARERRLLRTLLRALVISMRLEHCAGDTGAARNQLLKFIGLYETTDYARPLARDREIALPLLESLIDTHTGDPLAMQASDLRDGLTVADDPKDPRPAALFSQKEMDVLRRLESQPDKQIARDLSLSYHGLRYRIRQIFAKLGARGRYDAVHRARSLGILPDEGDEARVDLPWRSRPR